VPITDAIYFSKRAARNLPHAREMKIESKEKKSEHESKMQLVRELGKWWRIWTWFYGGLLPNRPEPIPIIIPQKKKKGSRQVIKQKATPRTQKEVTFSHRYLAAFYEFWLNEFVTLPCLSGSGYSLCFCWLLQPKLFFFGILCWYCFVDAF